MTAPRIKLCGIATADALAACLATRAEFVGFNFFPPSPRYVAPSAAAALAAQAGTALGKVGVFVDPTDLELAEAISAARLDAIQLHGEESPQRAAQIRTRFQLPVWKALPVAAPGDVERAHAFRQAADFVLFDARTPKGTLPGGMGLVFDWSLLANFRQALPWGLAGGLTPENVAEAVRRTGAQLVDTSSGIESAPGVKDVDRIAAFCQAARSI